MINLCYDEGSATAWKSVRDSWIPGIKIKGFVVLRGWIKGFCPRIPGFLSKFVRDFHPVADPSCYDELINIISIFSSLHSDSVILLLFHGLVYIQSSGMFTGK